MVVYRRVLQMLKQAQPRVLVSATLKPCCPASLTSLCSPSAIFSFFLLFIFLKNLLPVWIYCHTPEWASSWLLYEGCLNYSPPQPNWTQKHHSDTKLLDLLIPSYLLLLVSTTVPLLHVCHALKLISLAQWVRHGQPKDPLLSFSHSLSLTHVHTVVLSSWLLVVHSIKKGGTS